MYIESFKVFAEKKQWQPLFGETIDLLSSCVFIYPADITFYVCTFRGSLQPHAIHMRNIDVDLNVGKIQKVKFLWNNHVINLFRPKLGASQITVQSGENGTKCVSLIPPTSHCLYLPINLSTLPSNHPVTHLPTYNVTIYPTIHPSLSVHPPNHSPIHVPISHLSNLLAIQPLSTQLFISTPHLSNWFTLKNQISFSLSQIELGRSKASVSYKA